MESTPAQSAPFDIFEFLKITRREDVLHAPMLAGLLDPYGFHGLGDEFLRKFVATIDPSIAVGWSGCDWIVRQQQRVPGGRIDILLLCPRKRTAIAIETKIAAAESKSQLRAHHTWLSSLTPWFVDRRLIFLTLGGAPSRMLAGDSLPMRFSVILKLLRDCLAQRGSTEFTPAIRAYLEVLARLTGNDAPTAIAALLTSGGLINLFRFLRIARREEVLHTRMLAGLLDPAASHNQGRTFLRLALALILTDSSLAAACSEST